MAATETETLGVYVYGVTLTDIPCAGETVDVGRLRAVVSVEPLARYEREAIEAAVREPGWLEERLRAHDATLEAVHSAGPVAPFRFGTIFRTEAELRDALARAGADLATRLEELRGASEWGVKVWVDDDVLRSWLERQDEEARRARAELEAADVAGRRYLLEKKLSRMLETEAAEIALDHAHSAHAALAAEAREATAERPSGLDATERARPVLRASYLVDGSASESFERALADVRRRDVQLGIEYTLSGPWPPYSFVDVELT